jgi:single-stranded-DNA-specific exonuclease
MGFIYVPMINAIGRIVGKPDKAIDLFLINNKQQIMEYINFLKDVNETRKSMTEQQYSIAEKIVERDELKNVLVVYDKSFHEGIIGLIAGRLKEKYNRPTIVFTDSEEGLLKGSGRSIDGFNLKDELDIIGHLTVGHGGHAKAAGLTIEKANLTEFADAMVALGEERLSEEDFVKTYQVDFVLDPENVYGDICTELKMLEPYGEGFSKPNIVLDNFEITGLPFYMGKEKQHIKFKGRMLNVLMWNEAEEYKRIGEPNKLTILGYPETNTFNNVTSLQFTCKDYQVSY